MHAVLVALNVLAIWFVISLIFALIFGQIAKDN